MKRVSTSRTCCPWLCLTSAVFLVINSEAATSCVPEAPGQPATSMRGSRMKVIEVQRDPQNASDMLINRVRAAEKAGQWSEAIRLTNELLQSAEGNGRINPQRWQRTLGEFYAYDLDFDQAVLEFRKVLDGPDSGPGISGNLDKAYAAHGTAYVHARQGKYSDAMKWLDAWLKTYPSHCGTCQDSRQIAEHVLRSVWKAAALGGGKAETQLQALAGGGLQPKRGRLVLGTEKSQRDQAQMEARLVLGEMLLREGNSAQAKLMFEKVAKGNDDVAKVGASYLRRMKTQEGRQ